MDILISGNREVMKMIKEIPLDSNGNVDEKIFMEKVKEIVKGNKEDEV